MFGLQIRVRRRQFDNVCYPFSATNRLEINRMATVGIEIAPIMWFPMDVPRNQF